jgi:hypothetical protein
MLRRRDPWPGDVSQLWLAHTQVGLKDDPLPISFAELSNRCLIVGEDRAERLLALPFRLLWCGVTRSSANATWV